MHLTIHAPHGYKDQYPSGDSIPIPQLGSDVRCQSDSSYTSAAFKVIAVEYDYRDVEIDVTVTLFDISKA